MGTYRAPTKEQVRQYLKRRFGSNGPLPSPSEIRSELGWGEPSPLEKNCAAQNDLTPESEDSAA